MIGPAIHFRVTHYLPSWQGGDRELPRCRTSRLGITDPATPRTPFLSEVRAFVTCPHCRRMLKAAATATAPVPDPGDRYAQEPEEP